ncbi:hypothetical protein [uncultured Cohaesibacter sp.]|uniref:portal protein n=1 Tax=uncultured Cohaesibacter sp. TaxID=1002546 RepID=UPI0029C95E3A|nr:hypothetical protein [uncultured Cohaesibacter sp.]
MLSEDKLKSILDKKISAAEKYDDETQSEDREKALEYYRGEMSDLEPEEGRSSAKSLDVADAVEWIMPDMMQIFCGSGQPMKALPTGAEDEELANQQTDGTNWFFMNECRGYWVIHDLCHDALLQRNAVGKVWRDQTPVITIEEYEDLDPMRWAELVNSPNVEVLEDTEKEDGTHDLKIKVIKSKGRQRVEVLPRENFLISAEATSIEDTNFAADKTLETRSDLRERFADNPEALKRIDNLNSFGGFDDDDANESREKDYSWGEESADNSMDEIEIYECYVKADANEDGIAEWLQVVVSGGQGARVILSVEEWDDDLPYFDVTALRVPHRFAGRSLADSTIEIQAVKTALLRGALDNIYWQNNPEREVNVSAMDDDGIDRLNNRQFGNSIPVTEPNSVRYLTLPYFANQTFDAMEQMDRIAANRTGVSASSKGLDAEVLQNQSATANNNMMSAARSKAVFFARNMAEGGIQRMFKILMRLIAKYEDQRLIRLKGNWKPIDPRVWNMDMDVSVDVGLGSGTRERDMAILQMILARQEQMVREYGPDNPIVPFDKLLETFSKLIEAGGLRNPEQYYNDVPADQLQQWFAQFKQSQQPQADPAKMADIQLKQAQQQAEIQLKREQMQAELQLKREQMQLEMQLKREQTLFGARQSGFSTEVTMGGQPG